MIEINGIEYERRPQPEKKQLSRKALEVMMLAEMMGGLAYGGKKSAAPPNVNILQEYALIQQKQSSLSARERAWVVAEFEKQFQRVEKKD